MSERRSNSGSPEKTQERNTTPEIHIYENDEKFFQCLYDYIQYEKQYLHCPAEEADERRYVIYSSVFNKVIGRAKAYKRLLVTIKAEYDDVIRTLGKEEGVVSAVQRRLEAARSRSDTLMNNQTHAAELRQRISVLQSETSALGDAAQKRWLLKAQTLLIPGLTLAESEDAEEVDRHAERLLAERAALLDRRRCCVSLRLKAELEAEWQEEQRHREQLSSEEQRLRVQYRRLKLVSVSLCGWEEEEEEQRPPLEEFVGSTVEQLSVNSVTEDEGEDDSSSMDSDWFEGDEPTKVSQAKQVKGHLDSFMQLFSSSRFHEAALVAARSPGVLRNLDTMQMFKAVKASPGSAPPLLLFFQALLTSLPPGERLPAPLSLQGVRCALQQGSMRLLSHAVTHRKLSFSEALGDLLTDHAQSHPKTLDLCLALATVVYEACGLHRKKVLSLSRRGLIHTAALTMSRDFTPEDCMWVVSRSPSLSLLQLLTDSSLGRAAILSMGVACSSLLVDPQQQQVALQLLDTFASQGGGVLEEVILEDCVSVEVWSQVASLCSDLSRADLSRSILSALLSQSGTGVLSPDPEGSALMDHVFL